MFPSPCSSTVEAHISFTNSTSPITHIMFVAFIAVLSVLPSLASGLNLFSPFVRQALSKCAVVGCLTMAPLLTMEPLVARAGNSVENIGRKIADAEPGAVKDAKNAVKNVNPGNELNKGINAIKNVNPGNEVNKGINAVKNIREPKEVQNAKQSAQRGASDAVQKGKEIVQGRGL